MDEKGSNRFFLIMFGLMAISLFVLFLWRSVPAVSNSVNSVLDPTAGRLINWNLTIGSLIVFFIIAFISTIVQKYATDQETLKELKKEQKELQKEVQKFKDDPKKMMEMQKNIWPMSMKITQISMRSSLFTVIPFLLFFGWFMDFFVKIGSPKFFGIFSWFWFYLLTMIIFSSILRKLMKVA